MVIISNVTVLLIKRQNDEFEIEYFSCIDNDVLEENRLIA